MQYLKPCELKNALVMAVLVLELEAETSDVKEWRNECLRAKLAINEVLARPPAGEWFYSPGDKKGKVKQVSNG